MSVFDHERRMSINDEVEGGYGIKCSYATCNMVCRIRGYIHTKQYRVVVGVQAWTKVHVMHRENVRMRFDRSEDGSALTRPLCCDRTYRACMPGASSRRYDLVRRAVRGVVDSKIGKRVTQYPATPRTAKV